MVAVQENKVPALRFPKFIGKWCKTTIGENFEFKNGLNKEKEYFGHGTPIINFVDVYHLSVIQKKHVNSFVELSDKEIANFSVKKGDVFFTRTSETIDDIGMSATLVEDIENCVFSGFVLRARPVNKKLHSLYTSYCFSIESVRKEIVTKSSYTTRALTSGRLLNKVNFYHPSDPEEQQKIASFLSSVDTKIEQLGKKKALLEQYKKSMMQKLFSQEIRFKDEQGRDYPSWEENKLKDVGKIIGGGTPDTNQKHLWNGDILWFTPTEIESKYSGNSVRKISKEGLAKSSATLLPVGTVLFTSRATIGEVSIASKECATNQGFQSFVVDDSSFSNEYIYYWITKNKKQFLRRANGSTFLEISKGEIKKISFSAPSVKEQRKIADFLSAIDKKIELVTEQLTQAQTFKKGLLQQMFI